MAMYLIQALFMAQRNIKTFIRIAIISITGISPGG
jgi:hypothetical protein